MPPLRPDPIGVDEYYRDAAVRARILEQCGARAGHAATAAFVAGLHGGQGVLPEWDRASHVPPEQLESLWSQHADIARSLWDRQHLLFFLELDYQNIDAPAEPFRHPADVFLKLEPAYHAANTVFSSLSIPMRAVATGRGYHFLGQVSLDDPLVESLAAIIPNTPAWYAGVESRRPSGVVATMSERHARAAEGLGCLIEYAAHLILRRADDGGLPLVVNGTVVGNAGLTGRECVSIDFSHVGDPLDARHVRTAFSTYQWHQLRPDIFGADTARRAPSVAALPRPRRSLIGWLARGRDLAAARQAAHHTHSELPDIAAGMRALLDRYTTSPLAAFHRAFYRELSTGPRCAAPPRVPDLPPCISACLERPNDLLLKPEHLQHLVRGLTSGGWSAGEIVGLVRSTYEADHNWGDRWTTRMDPQTRAEFEVRVFAGLLATGVDTLVDFNCVSAQEKGICPGTGCGHDLRVDRDRLVTALT